jgi:hypothetical protein
MPSAGTAVSERTALEITLTAASLRAMRAFLVGVEKDAVSALASPVILAGIGFEEPEDVDEEEFPEPFALGKVDKRWRWFIAAVLAALPVRYATAIAVERLSNELLGSPLPGRVYTSVREVLSLAMQQQWSRSVVAQQLSTTLRMSTGTVARTGDQRQPLADSGTTWETQTRTLARTTATSTYGHASVRSMAADPGITQKRWVAVGDKHTRKSHARASGQTVNVSEPFMVGGAVMQYPGDPSGSYSETANCRCVVVGV